MTIKKAVAFKISLGDVILAEGVCGVTTKPDGSLPSETEISSSLVKAAVTNGSIDPVKVGTGILAVDLLFVKDDAPEDPFMQMMNQALESCPEVVETYRGGELVGNGSDITTGRDTEPSKPGKPAMTDAEFAYSMGFSMESVRGSRDN